MPLLDQIASFENLVYAYKACSKGKKKSLGYQKTVFNTGEKLLLISEKLQSGKFNWGPYREFVVDDPKKRLVMAAPFLDRVVHHAIHQIIDPILDKTMSDCVFACRKGRGNRFAAQHLIRRLTQMGSERYSLKLDVSKYFASISHPVLKDRLNEYLPDSSANDLLCSLLNSHENYAKNERGIPIGNLTSQLFANFYLTTVDRVACNALGHPYYWLEEEKLPKDVIFIRYMDDLLLIAHSKSQVCEAASCILEEIEKLGVEIPVRKRMHLGRDAIPFLGYLISHDFFRPLSRNTRKFSKIQRGLIKRDTRESELRFREICFNAWAQLEDDNLWKG